MNHEVSAGPLLDENGKLIEPGFAYQLVKEYHRNQIKGLKWRIKEWDYYAILRDDYAIALTVADNSYMSLVSVSYLNFTKPSYITKSFMGWFTFGKLGLPETSKIGDIVYKKKGYSFEFLNDGKERHLKVTYPKFDGDKTFTCDVVLKETSDKTMVIVTPWKKEERFYYNQKINCMAASGSFKIGDEEFSLDKSAAVLDWGRGTWTYKNTWYWSSMNVVDKEGNYKGFNLGYGFGDTDAASENMLFLNNTAYKLNDVKIEIPVKDGKDDFMSPWHFTSEDGSIDMIFEPIIDRMDCTDVLIICSKQHQVFGRFTGFIKADGVEAKFDHDLGFAEKVFNKW